MGAYTQSFGSTELDASVLPLAVVEFLRGSDPRLLATIDAIEQALSDERGLLYRYRGDDGLAAPAGSFLLCTFWLAHALALTGQVDPATGELLGNFPQAFSHLGLINAAQALADARGRSQDGSTPA